MNYRSKFTVGICVALCLMVTACQTPAPEAGKLSDEEVAGIKRAEQDWVKAVLAGDWAAGATLHTEDAVRLPPNKPAVRGRAAIEASLGQIGTVTDFKLSSVEVDGRDGFGWSWETYSITVVPPSASEPITATGKGLVVWQKQSNGAWLAHRVVWNNDNP